MQYSRHPQLLCHSQAGLQEASAACSSSCPAAEAFAALAVALLKRPPKLRSHLAMERWTSTVACEVSL